MLMAVFCQHRCGFEPASDRRRRRRRGHHGSQSQGRCCPWRITMLLSCCSRCCFTCSATELEAAARGEGRVKCKAQVVVLLENKKSKETRLETFSSHLQSGRLFVMEWQHGWPIDLRGERYSLRPNAILELYHVKVCQV